MQKSDYQPPYSINDRILNQTAGIIEILAKSSFMQNIKMAPMLRRSNRIKTIHASLAIENNSLSFEQVRDVIEGKLVQGPPTEIMEAKNAFQIYEQVYSLNPYDLDDMLRAHAILMKGLATDAGMFRSGGVGIYAGDQLMHMAPPAHLVPTLMQSLTKWTLDASNTHPLIKSCVFHYEFEFIHPFSDGNGRMGRMWQSLLLFQWNPLFASIPIEVLIKKRQSEYYEVLGKCDQTADSSLFIEFMLAVIHDTLKDMSASVQVGVQVTEQVKRLLEVFLDEPLSLQELMEKLGLKHRPSFRESYLLPAIRHGLIEMTLPDKPNSSKQKYRKL
jgi:Fic family protein